MKRKQLFGSGVLLILFTLSGPLYSDVNFWWFFALVLSIICGRKLISRAKEMPVETKPEKRNKTKEENIFYKPTDKELKSGPRKKTKHNLDTFVVVDLETTGFSPDYCDITEIGAIRFVNGEETGRYSTYVNPGQSIPEEITKLTGITNEKVANAPNPTKAINGLLDFIAGDPLVGHNIPFDIGFIQKHAPCYNPVAYDTLPMSRKGLPSLSNHKLTTLKDYYNISGISHSAIDDCKATALVFINLLKSTKPIKANIMVNQNTGKEYLKELFD